MPYRPGCLLTNISYTHRCLAACLILLSATHATASNFQDFSGITYSNPAELTLQVKDMQLIIGDEYFSPSPKIDFTGTVIVPDPSPMGNNVVVSGNANNIDYATYPYGRIAKRMTDQWVIGVDITKPFSSDIVYPDNSPARYSVTYSGMQSLDIAPNIAYQFSGAWSKLALGFGLDAMHYVVDLDAKYPSLPSPATPFGSGLDLGITNHATNWGCGWHAGLIYHLFQGTILGLSYFSQINQNFTNGTSSVTGFPVSNSFSTTLNLPATTHFSILQFLNPKWSMMLKVHYSQWDSLQQVVLKNTAGPLSTQFINLYYKNTWRVDLGTRYDLTPKWSVGGLFAYDQTPSNNTSRSLGLPGVNQTILGTSVIYKLTKTIALEGSYGHIFAIDAPIKNVDPNSGVTTNGTVNISGNVIGLQLAMNV